MQGEAAEVEAAAQVLPPSRTRSEIDTKPPFQSVQEAVRLFGERVLAGELRPKKSARDDQTLGGNGACPCSSNHKLGSVMLELEETKQSLEMARQEATRMANSLYSLQSELQLTKQRLQQLINDKAYDEPEPDKTSVQYSPPDHAVDVEDLKFIEAAANYSSSSARFCDDITLMKNNNTSSNYEAAGAGGSNGSAGGRAQAFVMKEFQKKRYVTFANPPCLDRVVLPRHEVREAEVVLLERNASLKRKKKKPFIPSIIGGIFSKKK